MTLSDRGSIFISYAYGYRKCSSINGLNVFVSLVFSLIMAGHIDGLRLQNYKRGWGHRLDLRK